MKLVSLISSGIDSPVATYLLSKKAEEIILLHGDIQPFTDKREVENFLELVKHLKKITSCSLKVYLVPHGASLSAFKQNCNNKFTCVFCKRMLLRYAEKIAEEGGAEGIIMGDSLGQVASQTLQNIRTIEQAVKIPVLRPLIGLDKENVVKIAKEIDTYDFSILPSDGCNAVPNKPSTRARLEQIFDEESKLNVDELINDAVTKSEIIKI
ncbi:MAG: 7-cyano-7-deazaguanine synthase [Thermoplasmatales archaeon]|nr:7-cyano-7-deazaguanine synthase [Thermoplasmatales archaeon]